MAERKITITVEGDGPGAETALARLIEALRLVTEPRPKPSPPTPRPQAKEGAA
jgi:hypothetical protein